MTPQDALVCRNVRPRSRCETLIDLLRDRAEDQPDRLAFRFLLDGEQEEATLTYGELDQRARAVGAWLREHLPSPGRPVALLHRPGLDFLAAFFGCLYGGAIAIPTYPPHPARRNRTASRLEAIVADAAPAAALTTSDLLPAVEPLMRREDAEPSGLLAVDRLWEPAASSPGDPSADELAARWTRPAVDADSLAMLQYTSGSTGTPNGVMLSHGNLLHNSEQIRIFFEHTEDSQCLSWLPPYHDMGLIGGILQPLYAGFPSTLFSPLHFLQQPIRWLRAVTRWKITSSGGPNFAYDLCVEKISPEERGELDLSSWDVAWNGAEPVRADTLDRFAAAFASCGFRREAFYPCYGLAEATLMVSGGVKADPPVIEHAEAERLENGQVVSTTADARGARSLVGCGRTIPEQEIILVDPEHRLRCQPSQVGEIWVRGPSVTHGYWGRSEQTANTFAASLADTGEGPFLRTGDLGFLKDGELFVTGRLKDLIILDGRNLYPQDIERSVEESHPAIRPGCCMAFSVDQDSVERLIVVAEVERTYWSNVARRGDAVAPAELQPLFKAIRRAVSETHDARIANILLVRPASLPKTPSGKHQRRACRETFLRGTLPEVLATG
jgi:acyl-CoA synthetase (AMP-forming)/AMP-acid ligase II